MRSVLVVQCSPCRCAISTAASQIGSGSRVRGGFALRHASNRWLSCNKSSGTAVFSWAMPKRYYSTLHRVTHACRKLTTNSRTRGPSRAFVQVARSHCATESSMWIGPSSEVLRRIAYAEPPLAIVTKLGTRQIRFTHSSASEASQINSRVPIASPTGRSCLTSNTPGLRRPCVN